MMKYMKNVCFDTYFFFKYIIFHLFMGGVILNLSAKLLEISFLCYFLYLNTVLIINLFTMKKLFLLSMLALFSLTMSAQESKFFVGANVGMPTGDISDLYSVSFGADVNYMFNTNFGVAVGYQSFSGKTISILGTDMKIPSASFLPIAAAGRYNLSDAFVLGADVGYAVGMSPEGNDGGFYYKPMLAYAVASNVSINVHYSGIGVDGGTFSSLGLGVLFGL